MADKRQDNADTLINDGMSLADSLGGLETRDWVERVGYALDWGNVKFAELLDRRQSLSMDAVDAATMDSILDTIRARIHFLQSLHRRNAKNSGSSNFEVGK